MGNKRNREKARKKKQQRAEAILLLSEALKVGSEVVNLEGLKGSFLLNLFFRQTHQF